MTNYKMTTVLTIFQVFVVLILVLLVFMQKNNSEGVANLTGSSANSIVGKDFNNILSKCTMLLAILFMANSLFLAKLSNDEYRSAKSLIHGNMNDIKSESNKEDDKVIDVPLSD